MNDYQKALSLRRQSERYNRFASLTTGDESKMYQQLANDAYETLNGLLKGKLNIRHAVGETMMTKYRIGRYQSVDPYITGNWYRGYGLPPRVYNKAKLQFSGRLIRDDNDYCTE